MLAGELWSRFLNIFRHWGDRAEAVKGGNKASGWKCKHYILNLKFQLRCYLPFFHQTCTDTLSSIKSYCRQTHMHLQTKASPFAAEVQSSRQTYDQQTHTENSHNYLLFSHWLNDELRVATPGAIEAPLTPATQRDESFMITWWLNAADTHSLTHSHTHTHTHTGSYLQWCSLMSTSSIHWPLFRQYLSNELSQACADRFTTWGRSSPCPETPTTRPLLEICSLETSVSLWCLSLIN